MLFAVFYLLASTKQVKRGQRDSDGNLLPVHTARLSVKQPVAVSRLSLALVSLQSGCSLGRHIQCELSQSHEGKLFC